MDYPYAKFDEFSFSRFGFNVRINRHTESQTDADDRHTHAASVMIVLTYTSLTTAATTTTTNIMMVALSQNCATRPPYNVVIHAIFHSGILFLLCCEIRTSHCCTSDYYLFNTD